MVYTVVPAGAVASAFAGVPGTGHSGVRSDLPKGHGGDTIWHDTLPHPGRWIQRARRVLPGLIAGDAAATATA